jgi:hypothetical protein
MILFFILTGRGGSIIGCAFDLLIHLLPCLGVWGEGYDVVGWLGRLVLGWGLCVYGGEISSSHGKVSRRGRLSIHQPLHLSVVAVVDALLLYSLYSRIGRSQEIK